MVSIARKNLLEDIPRFLVAQAGIMFAVSLVTIQTGIYAGFSRSSVSLIDNSDADLWVASEQLVQLEQTLPIPVAHLIAARELKGVARAEGLLFSGAQWYPTEGEITRTRLVGFDPLGTLYKPPAIVEGQLADLEKPYGVIIDRMDADTLSVGSIGTPTRLNSINARVLGFTEGHTSMVSNPFVLTSLENATAFLNSGQTSQITCQIPPGGGELSCENHLSRAEREPQDDIPPPPVLAASDLITYVLVEAEPGQDLAALQQALEQNLPGTKTFTAPELRNITQHYWRVRTGIGFVLGVGAAVGAIVGTVVVSQILYSSVSDHLKEFGTLKAIGASARTIYGVIIEQSLWMAVLGYLPGMALCLGVSSWAAASQGILIVISPLSAAGVFGLTAVMCVGSAIFAIQKVNRVDPAIVFKA
ncbi:MAG: FtsX-like permease family protein [Cyanobacteria bacterium J06641_5]